MWAGHAGTRITTSHECPRRSFLDERVAGDGSNDKAVKGTLTHNLIQASGREAGRVAGLGCGYCQLGGAPPAPDGSHRLALLPSPSFPG